MWKCLPVLCFAGLVALAAPLTEDDSIQPIYIIKPPIRCPEGMRPDSKGRCRVVWKTRGVNGVCPEGTEMEDGFCLELEEAPECNGEECVGRKLEKRDVTEREAQTETIMPVRKQRRMESLKKERKMRRTFSEDGKQARSKHAFLMMLKKKKMQMMKPKPPPPPPPHHPPHHHPPPEEEPEEPEEEAETEPPEEAPARLFFADEMCPEAENTTCQPDVEVMKKADENNEFKEWKPEKEPESSDSSSSSSSSPSSSSSTSSSSSSVDSTGESESENESEGGSGESEDEVLEKAIKIKLMKIFRMKQRYGPALRRWLVSQLREYEDSLDY